MTTPKRKQQSISLETKQKIITESAAGKSYGQLAKDFGLAKSTVSTIVSNKDKISNAIEGGIGAKRARLTNAKNPDLEEAVLTWFKQVRSLNVAVTGPLLKVIFKASSAP
jgi:transposase-like protein